MKGWTQLCHFFQRVGESLEGGRDDSHSTNLSHSLVTVQTPDLIFSVPLLEQKNLHQTEFPSKSRCL